MIRPDPKPKQYKITPTAKPRQTRADVWKKRPCVMRYRAFADQVRAMGVEVPESCSRITFIIQMPKSWSKSKKKEMMGSPHCQKPDIDNLCKALLDAIYDDDSVVWDISLRKVWGDEGGILIESKS